MLPLNSLHYVSLSRSYGMLFGTCLAKPVSVASGIPCGLVLKHIQSSELKLAS